VEFIGAAMFGAKNEALFTGRVPHVRLSVHGPKKTGRSPSNAPLTSAKRPQGDRCGATVAYLFSISRAIIRRWISLVPSPMVQSLTSR
jgi:hypothetical protein